MATWATALFQVWNDPTAPLAGDFEAVGGNGRIPHLWLGQPPPVAYPGIVSFADPDAPGSDAGGVSIF